MEKDYRASIILSEGTSPDSFAIFFSVLLPLIALAQRSTERSKLKPKVDSPRSQVRGIQNTVQVKASQERGRLQRFYRTPGTARGRGGGKKIKTRSTKKICNTLRGWVRA